MTILLSQIVLPIKPNMLPSLVSSHQELQVPRSYIKVYKNGRIRGNSLYCSIVIVLFIYYQHFLLVTVQLLVTGHILVTNYQAMYSRDILYGVPQTCTMVFYDLAQLRGTPTK